MNKIILAGASLNSGNKGVNALTKGQIMLILDKYGVDTEIIIVSYTVNNVISNIIKYNNKEIEIKEIPCSIRQMIGAYLKSKSIGNSYIIDEIKSADYVWDISEGDSFSDIYGVKRFIQHSLLKLITINLKRNLVIMPQTLGPFQRSWVKKVAKYILSNSNKVFVRDEISKKVAQEELGITREIKYIPDMAFYMKPDSNISLKRFVDNIDTTKIGINVSALLYNGGYTRNNMFNLKCDYNKLVEDIIITFSKLENTEIILIPHVMTNEFEVEDDFRLCNKIVDEMNKKYCFNIKTIDKHYREDEIKAIISGCDFFIGSRMHACIGAVSTLVPTAPIAYSRKFIGIWDKLGLSYCVADPKIQDEDDIIKNIISNFNKREEIKETLNNKIPLLKKEIENIVDLI